MGLNAAYQRQKETYQQYINQEIFASSFGKGDSTFGWTFGANPGTRTLAPGQRNTYAIFSVPTNALAIVMLARACVFDRRDRLHPERDCETDTQNRAVWEKFIVQIPSEYDSGYWISEVRYSPVIAGTRQMVYLSGRHCSNLTGVTVNGVPLRRTVSIAAPELAVKSLVPNGDAGIEGEYELVGSDQMILAFKMPAGYTGTPSIALITPVKARYLNDLPLRIRVGARRYERPNPTTPNPYSLSHPEVFPMFYARPEIKSVRLTGSQLHVEGTGLSLLDQFAQKPWVRYYWNDQLVPLIRPAVVGGSVSAHPVAERIVLAVNPAHTADGSRADLRMEFDPELGIQPVRFVTSNPGALTITKATIVKFIPPVAADPKKRVAATPSSALLEVEGTQLEPNMQMQIEYNDGSSQTVGTRIISDAKLVARIQPPGAGGFALFTLTSPSAVTRDASGFVEIPALQAKKDPDFIVTEQTVKQVPAPKKEK